MRIHHRTTIRKRIIGRSVCGAAIECYEIGPLDHPTLIIGGFHGDEPKSVYVARRLLEVIRDAVNGGASDTSAPGRIGRLGGPGSAHRTERFNVVIVPLLNPDGFGRRRRKNARGVDLNRNFPTRNWQPSPPRRRYHGGPRPASEPETRALIRLIERVRPQRIITIHSIDRWRQCNNYDGPGWRLATMLRRFNHYPVTVSIGYPTPGSFGAWAGVQGRIPTVTLELPSHHSPQRCWRDNAGALLATIGAE